MIIIPTVLESDFEKAESRVNEVSGTGQRIQIDVIDNVFTAGKSFEIELVTSLPNSENLVWETHLMVKEPIKWVEKCLFIGSSRIIGQIEMMSDRQEFVNKIQEEGIEAGVAFDIDSDIKEIPDNTDVVLLMGRKAGWGKLELDERIWEKIEKVKRIRDETSDRYQIAVDGGVKPENYKKLEEAGVDIAYCGINYLEIKENAGRNE